MTFTNVDDFLESIPAKHREKPARLLKIVREAYTWGVPPMIAKSMTDRLNENNEYSFHLGTTDPELRKNCIVGLYQYQRCKNNPIIY